MTDVNPSSVTVTKSASHALSATLLTFRRDKSCRCKFAAGISALYEFSHSWKVLTGLLVTWQLYTRYACTFPQQLAAVNGLQVVVKKIPFHEMFRMNKLVSLSRATL